MKTRAKRGFTLVEILIVVVILGILAAIVIPQFSQASTDAKANSLMSDLQTLRSQISLYKIQHNDKVPALVDVQLDVSAVGTGALTGYTDVDGDIDAKDATHIYGPYLLTVPVNPFTGTNTVGATNASGWVYVVTSGTEATIHAGADTTPDTLLHEAY